MLLLVCCSCAAQPAGAEKAAGGGDAGTGADWEGGWAASATGRGGEVGGITGPLEWCREAWQDFGVSWRRLMHTQSLGDLLYFWVWWMKLCMDGSAGLTIGETRTRRGHCLKCNTISSSASSRRVTILFKNSLGLDSPWTGDSPGCFVSRVPWISYGRTKTKRHHRPYW